MLGVKMCKEATTADVAWDLMEMVKHAHVCGNEMLPMSDTKLLYFTVYHVVSTGVITGTSFITGFIAVIVLLIIIVGAGIKIIKHKRSKPPE